MRHPVFLALITAPLFAQIVDTQHSKAAALHPVPVAAVTIPDDSFWGQRRKITLERSMPTMFDELEKHGTLDNFRRLAGKGDLPRRGPLYTDSDLYKWLEAAAYFLPSDTTGDLKRRVDLSIDVIAAAQEPSGYLDTFYVGEREKLRFSEMYRSHELYCLGHLLQAAVAMQRAVGDRRLLDIGIKYTNYVLATLGPDKKPALTGHPEFEMALVELTRMTGDTRYRDYAGYLLSGVETERLKLRPEQTTYMFSGISFTSRTAFVGHAVRAMYAACGATDYYAETGDAKYRSTLELLWKDAVSHKLYITGGVGSRAEGEAFGEPFELPNAQAYIESCAAIANYMWNWRMLLVEAEPRFGDVMERALYNGINSGMSLDGTLYCYRNPLESRGEKIRNEFYDTDCCPPNIERLMAELPGYFYATDAESVFVNLYGASTLNWHLRDGAPLKLTQATNYPWDGKVDITLDTPKPVNFALKLRIPVWSARTRVSVNGTVTPSNAGQWTEIRRDWKRGDHVQITFDMAPRLTEANALVRENAGRVAVERGPLVYCLEKPDQSLTASLFDASLSSSPTDRFSEHFDGNLLNGVVVLQHNGRINERPLEEEPLYRDLSQARAGSVKPAMLTFIPYYAWANRGQQEMEVWVPLADTATRASR